MLNPGTDRERRCPSKIPYRKAQRRATCSASSRPSGGGYGDPARRDPAAIRRDIEDGLLSREGARRDYPGYR